MALPYIDFTALNQATTTVGNTGVTQKTKDIFGLVVSGLQALGPTLALLFNKQGISTDKIIDDPEQVARQIETSGVSLEAIQLLIDKATRSANTDNKNPTTGGINIDYTSPTTYIVGFAALFLLFLVFKYFKF
jgi:hypothetical protein